MKTLTVFLTLIIAVQSQAYNSSYRVEARYQGTSFAALTGDQDNSLSEQEKVHLLQSRANQICDFFFAELFGEMQGSFDRNSLAPAQDEALIIADEGEIIKTSITQTTSPGYLGGLITGGTDINPGLVFTQLTCSN